MQFIIKMIVLKLPFCLHFYFNILFRDDGAPPYSLTSHTMWKVLCCRSHLRPTGEIYEGAYASHPCRIPRSNLLLHEI